MIGFLDLYRALQASDLGFAKTSVEHERKSTMPPCAPRLELPLTLVRRLPLAAGGGALDLGSQSHATRARMRQVDRPGFYTPNWEAWAAMLSA